MELSNAISKGAALRTQAIGSLVGAPHGGSPDIPATCVLGAALEGVGLLTISEVNHVLHTFKFTLGREPCDQSAAADWSSELSSTFPILEEHVAWSDLPCGCPDLKGGTEKDTSVHGVLIHLNDFHKWRRELIAQWVRSIERK